MKKLFGIVVLCLVLSGNAYTKETKLHCKFIGGDKVVPGKQKIIYEEGDLSDEYLKIDFDREKVIDHPFKVYGLFSSENTIIFDGAEVSWTGKNKYIRKVAILNRQDGRLIEVYNILDDSREAGERNYLCSETKFKF
ncbi:hypothetical protein N9U84_04665 [Candidatus Pelagibacter sp.]|nr:hypothetical protein [Candidatus Pelagibacter sp.]